VLAYGISKQRGAKHCIAVEQVATLNGILQDAHGSNDPRSMLLFDSSNGKMGTISFRDVRYSLLSHMVAQNYDYMCAQHIDVPLSYCILHLRNVNAYLDVFNVDITGLVKGYAMNRETKLICGNAEEVIRFRSVWAEVTLLDGRRHERLFHEELSFSLQQIFELQHNLSPCEPDIKKFAHYVKRRIESSIKGAAP
jgi:hypothetical protein